MGDKVEDPKALFKKRTAKASIRQKSIDNNNHFEDEEVGINTEKINEFKLLKSLKSRDVGIEYSADGQIAKRDVEKSSSHAPAEFGSRLKDQFSSQIDRGIGANIAHENIMHNYIDEKLGIKKDFDSKKSKTSDSSGLYSIPKELIVESKLTSSQVRVANEEGASSSWSTGIAEVALPDSYREKNKRATEEATRRQAEKFKEATISKVLLNSSAVGEMSSYRRFQLNGEAKQSMTKMIPEEIIPVVSNATGSVADIISADNDDVVGNKRPLRSTDDATVKKFKQQIQSKWR